LEWFAFESNQAVGALTYDLSDLRRTRIGGGVANALPQSADFPPRRRRLILVASQQQSAISVILHGTGPTVVLVHGGASPATTWRGLESLSENFTLAFVHRRGFPPSPPPVSGRQDFEVDAEDLMPLLYDRPHVIGHSYGGVSAAIAAIRSPDRVRSLTLIEPAIFIPECDPVVDRFRRIADTVLADGIDTDPVLLREFLDAAGAPLPDNAALPQRVIAGIRRAQGGRPPSEARPELAVLARAGTPALVASGDHHPAVERVCDAIAAALGAQRVIFRGAGHFVPAAQGFATRLQRFLQSVA